MKFNEVLTNHTFKTLKEITDLYDNPKDLVKIYNNMGIGYPKEHSADTFSSRIEKEANSQNVRYPNDLLKYREGSCIEHALFMHYFCEASGIYSKIAICEVIAEVNDVYYNWGHATCFIKIDKNTTGLFVYNGKKEKWEIQISKYNMDKCISLFQRVIKLCAQRTIVYEKNFLASIFRTVYNTYCIEFDKYDSLAKAYDSHYNKKDITRIDFYYKYVAKEFKKKYGKDFINSDNRPKNYLYFNTNISLIQNIYDAMLILLKATIL